MKKELIFKKITAFLTQIAIAYQLTSIEGDTFLPGLKVNVGVLLIDKSKCLYYRDILHEAGHVTRRATPKGR